MNIKPIWILASSMLLSEARLPSHSQLPSSSFERTVFMDEQKARELVGISPNVTVQWFNGTMDTTGISFSLSTGIKDYSYAYAEGRYFNLVPSNLVYDTGIYRTAPNVNSVSGANALISHGSSSFFQRTYISDGTLARSILKDADLAGLNPNNIQAVAASFSNGNLFAAAKDNYENYSYSIFSKVGDSPLKRTNTAPLSDPRGNRFIESIDQIIPTRAGFALYTQSAYGNTVYEYRNGGLVPIYDQSGDYFGNGEEIFPVRFFKTATPQDGIIFRYYNESSIFGGLGLYRDGNFTRIAQSGQVLPDGLGTISGLDDALLDNGDIILNVRLENSPSGRSDTVILRWRNGTFELIDRFSSEDYPVYVTLSGFINGSFIANVPTYDSDGTRINATIYRYSSVPEPSTASFLAVLTLGGIYLRCRSSRLAVSLREIQC